MTTSIKNNKKVSIIRSVAMMLTVALAIGFSSFTNAHRLMTHPHRVAKSGMIADDFIVQPTNGNFTELASPDPSACGTPATKSCVYDVSSSGQNNIPDQASYSSSDIDTYVTNGWLTPDSQSSNALYQPSN